MSDQAILVRRENTLVAKKDSEEKGGKTKVALWLDNDSIARLKELEDKYAVSFSGAIRMAVKEWLDNHPLLKGKK